MAHTSSGPSLWGWPLEAIQFWFVAAMIAVALLRQFIAWGVGYWRYGRERLVVCRAPRTHHPHLPRLAMRCPKHLDQKNHPEQRFDQNALAYERHDNDRDLVVRPAAAGTRHWSYEAVEGKRIGWPRWWIACLSLAVRKRFKEPSVDPCHYC